MMVRHGARYSVTEIDWRGEHFTKRWRHNTGISDLHEIDGDIRYILISFLLCHAFMGSSAPYVLIVSNTMKSLASTAIKAQQAFIHHDSL